MGIIWESISFSPCDSLEKQLSCSTLITFVQIRSRKKTVQYAISRKLLHHTPYIDRK